MILDNFFFLGQIVLQPTTACNLNCTYCYLPSRKKSLRMELEVTERLAQSLDDMNLDYPVSLVWHGGEPLMLGRHRFIELLKPLEKLRKLGKINHVLQTNATMIDESWCAVFKEYDFSVGVSIDGPRPVNTSRIDWQGNDSFDKIVEGIACLRRHNINFTCIVVVTPDSLDKAAEMYQFFKNLGCTSVGINIEECVGIHTGTSINSESISKFWKEIFLEWQKDPVIQIREFTDIIQWMTSVTDEVGVIPSKTDIFPTIGWNGDVVLLSPELLDGKYNSNEGFTVGNITQENLAEILHRGQHSSYVREYVDGVRKCEAECKFFPYCRGGQASNKFFELGTMSGTETQHCINSQQKPLETVLEFVENSYN